MTLPADNRSMSRRLHKPLWAVAALLCVNAVLLVAQPALALPQGLEDFLFGPKLVRAEVILQDAGGVYDYRIDRGRIRTVGADSIALLERDGTVVTIPVAPTAEILFKNRRVLDHGAPARHDRDDRATRRRAGAPGARAAVSQPASLESTGRLEPASGPLVLVVEDELAIGQLIRSYLSGSGYRVLWVRSGEDALAELARHEIRIVVLDIGLPGIDGFDVCREIRNRSDLPIVMLTARDEEIDRVLGLEVGADDYVAKPFSPRELTARLKAVLRRTDGPTRRDVLALGDVELRRDEREVRVAGELVDLTVKEFDLLAWLVENAGIVFSRDQLLDRVWGMTFEGGTRTVDVHVAQVRRKLDRPQLIRTVRGSGYKAVRE